VKGEKHPSSPRRQEGRKEGNSGFVSLIIVDDEAM